MATEWQVEHPNLQRILTMVPVVTHPREFQVNAGLELLLSDDTHLQVQARHQSIVLTFGTPGAIVGQYRLLAQHGVDAQVIGSLLDQVGLIISVRVGKQTVLRVGRGQDGWLAYLGVPHIRVQTIGLLAAALSSIYRLGR